MATGMNKADMAKELARLQSMDVHKMWFYYRGFEFTYVEDAKGARVHVTKCFENSLNGTPVSNHIVKPFSKAALQTWAVCWCADYLKKEEHQDG